MSVLALMAAEARSDGGAGLQRLLHSAKFDERPRLSLTKFDERPHVSFSTADEPRLLSKRFAA
jgi:hypothetical protein